MPNSNGEYTCDRCDRAFKDKELLFRHQACHDEEKPFECLECGKKFAKAGLLRDHRKRHFEVGAFECGWCKKRFYTPNKVRKFCNYGKTIKTNLSTFLSFEQIT